MDFLGLVGTVATVAIIFSLAWMALSIYMCYWAYKRKGVVGLLLAFFLNWVGWIIVGLMEKDEPERERERERELIRIIRLNCKIIIYRKNKIFSKNGKQ